MADTVEDGGMQMNGVAKFHGTKALSKYISIHRRQRMCPTPIWLILVLFEFILQDRVRICQTRYIVQSVASLYKTGNMELP
jgi:hypothetical protein